METKLTNPNYSSTSTNVLITSIQNLQYRLEKPVQKVEELMITPRKELETTHTALIRERREASTKKGAENDQG